MKASKSERERDWRKEREGMKEMRRTHVAIDQLDGRRSRRRLLQLPPCTAMTQKAMEESTWAWVAQEHELLHE